MIWMLLSAIFGAAFGHIMRNAQGRGRHMAWVGACNYAMAAVASWAAWGLQPEARMSWVSAVLGCLTGACFAGAYFIMDPCLRLAGVGVTIAMARLSIALPVAVSIFFWGEKPGALRVCGFLLACAAFPLLVTAQPVPVAGPRRRKFALLGACLLVHGISGVTMKAQSRSAAPDELWGYMAMLFLAATAVSTAVAWQRGRPNGADLAHGTVLGASNVAATLTMLCALATLPGTVVFPTTSAATMVLTVLSAAILWRERFCRKALAGLVLAVLALIMINM